MNTTRPTLLLVEDDSILRSMLVYYLETKFRIIAVASGKDAIHAIAHTQTIDLLITDFELGHSLDGLDVLTAARTAHSNLPAILITGSELNDYRIRDFRSREGTSVLQKPFQWEQLECEIRSRLTYIDEQSTDPLILPT